MIFLTIAILVISVLAKSPIDSEISEVEELLQRFSAARSVLTTKKNTNDLTPISLTLNGEEWLLSKIIPRFHFVYSKSVINVQFITLKPIGAFRDTVNSVNVALVVGYSDGQIDIIQHTGEVLCSYTLSYIPILLATTSNYDEIKIATISPALTLDIFDLSMEKVRKTNETESASTLTFQIVPESSDKLFCEKPTSIIFYVKTGKKFWIIGDELGDINIHLFNGTLFKKTETKLGKITAHERFGQTLVFATETSVGVINPSNMEILTVCNDIGHVLDICIDTVSSSAYVFALTGQKLFALDTKYNLNNENFCKVLGSREIEDNPKALACARNYLVTWGDLKAKLHNSTFHYSGDFKDIFQITSARGQQRHLESYRIQSGGSLFLMSSETEVFMYEVVLPYKTAPPFDFGNIRFIVIIFAIGGALLWQYYRKGSGSSQDPPVSKSRKYNMPRSIPKRRS